MNFGITLSNRGIPVGLCSARDLLALADAVEACPVMDSVWCGDALFVNRRLDALTLLAAVAGCTELVYSRGSELALMRVGTIADGWMTHSVSPGGFQRSWDFILKTGRESGRDMSAFDNVLYHHINVNADKQEALADSKKFLDLHYSADYTKARLEAWLTYGSPRECVEHIKRFKASGCRRITFRISTMGDPMAQLRRLVEDVLPYVD
jgi:alkanesulfonate monooxygenase SsuD/methylene tetrahydromethanopterin reductase-like flavin-dependent oxidoreductase (luciferase family)